MAHVDDIEQEFFSIKQQSGARAYIACFGKTFVDESDPHYMTSKTIGAQVVESGFGVLHGGYIGTMQAVSAGANAAIAKDSQKSTLWNVGVPMQAFDGKVERSDCTQLTATKNILDRKRVLVDSCDACIALPIAGVGTLLEVLEIFHLNQINAKFGGKIRPIIFYGPLWPEVMNALTSALDLTGQADGSAFTTYVADIEALKGVLTTIQITT